MRLRISRIDLQGTLAAGDGLIQRALFLQRDTKVVVRLGEIGPRRQRRAVARGRRVQPAPLVKRDAKVEVRDGIALPEGRRLPTSGIGRDNGCWLRGGHEAHA